MFKRISVLMLPGILAFSMVGAALASAVGDTENQQTDIKIVARAEATAKAQTESNYFYLNGEPVDQTGMHFVNGVLYCSVRAFFEAALPDVSVSWANNQIQVNGSTQEGESLNVTAKPGDHYLTANGRCLYVKGAVTSVSGVVMAPAGVLAYVFGGTIAWNADTSTANVTLGSKLLTSGESFYDTQSLDLLSRLINAEAGNQPIQGKIAVGNVIMNRVNSSLFPNTIYGVVYAKNQFSVVNNGAINRTPNESSLAAAKLTLEGVSVLPDALYFNQAGMNCWAARNRSYVTTIGGHSFYA